MKIYLIWIKILILIKDMKLLMVQELNHGKKAGMDFKHLEKYYKIPRIQVLWKLVVVLVKISYMNMLRNLV